MSRSLAQRTCRSTLAQANHYHSWPLAETSKAASARAAAAAAAAPPPPASPSTPKLLYPSPSPSRCFSSSPRGQYAATAAAAAASSSSSSSSTTTTTSGSPPSPAEAASGALQTLHPPSHLASYFYPASLRPHYLALQALHLELALIPTTVSSEILGRIRYGWWRDAIRACFLAKQGDGSAARRWKHPIVVALERAIWDPQVRARGGLVQDHFEAIIDAWEASLSTFSTSPTLDALEATSERLYSRQFYLHLNLVGLSHPRVDELFSHLGKALGLLEAIVSTPASLGIKMTPTNVGQGAGAGAGRVAKSRKPSLAESTPHFPLPIEYLQEHNVTQEAVLRYGGQAPGFRDAIFATATRANDYLLTARKTLQDGATETDPALALKGGRMPDAAKPALVGAATIPFLLQRLEKYDFDPFQPAFRLEAKGRGWRLPAKMWGVNWSGKI